MKPLGFVAQLKWSKVHVIRGHLISLAVHEQILKTWLKLTNLSKQGSDMYTTVPL